MATSSAQTWSRWPPRRRDLMPYSTESWTSLQGIEALPDRICTMQPEDAKQAFLRAFEHLYARD